MPKNHHPAVPTATIKPVLLAIWKEQRALVGDLLRLRSGAGPLTAALEQSSAQWALTQLNALKHTILKQVPAHTEGSISPGNPPETLAELMEADVDALNQAFRRRFPR